MIADAINDLKKLFKINSSERRVCTMGMQDSDQVIQRYHYILIEYLSMSMKIDWCLGCTAATNKICG